MHAVVECTHPAPTSPAAIDVPPSSFVLKTPDSVMCAASREPALSPTGTPADLARWRADLAGPVVGALPFTGDRVALAPAPDLSRRSTWTPTPAGRTRGHLAATTGPARPCPDPARYRLDVAAAIDAIAAGEMTKVVLGRYVHRAVDPRVPVAARADVLLARIAAAHPEGRVYRAVLPGGDVLVGASPELLVSRHGRTVRSHPLAGSARRHPEPARDEETARALLASRKDQREHALVVEMIADTLAPWCRRLSVPDAPALVATPTVWHLGSWIEGDLRDDTTSLELAAALQPTPALCGTPRDEARALIERLEAAPREFFGGAVGWESGNGDGEWTVAIRGARVAPAQITTFAGAGIVAGSDPATELAETTAKLASLDAAFDGRADSAATVDGRNA